MSEIFKTAQASREAEAIGALYCSLLESALFRQVLVGPIRQFERHSPDRNGFAVTRSLTAQEIKIAIAASLGIERVVGVVVTPATRNSWFLYTSVSVCRQRFRPTASF